MPVAHSQLWQPKIALEIDGCSLEKQMSLSAPLGTSDLSLYPYPYSYLHLSWGGALINLSSSMLGTRPIAYAVLIFIMILSGTISTDLDDQKVQLREINNSPQNTLQYVNSTWQCRKGRIPALFILPFYLLQGLLCYSCIIKTINWWSKMKILRLIIGALHSPWASHFLNLHYLWIV